ncbi:MAG: c-type cytochrome [Burkholderiales bacterium]
MSCIALALAIGASAAARAAGDPAKGAQLHQSCFGCHGTELYVPPRAKVKSLSALRKEVSRWNDRMNPKFTKQEMEDLVAYLNTTFYRLP